MTATVSTVSSHHARVRAAFAGAASDRVAICEQAFASSVASQIFGREMLTGSTDLHYFESCAWLDGERAHEEFVEKLYDDCLALHRRFDFDILYLPWRLTTRPTKRVGEHRILYGDPDGNDWSIAQFDPRSRTYGEVESGRAEPTFEEVADSIRAVLAKPRSPAGEVDPLLRRAVREQGAEFVVAGHGGMGIPMTTGWLEATVLDPGLLADYLDVVVENQLAHLEAQHEAGIWFINGGGDFAFNSGPVYSPKFFHDVMAPRWKRIFDFCRDRGMVYVMRSDGNLWPVADDLFGWANPHAYYECDYDAGMRFADLRARFPLLTLIGNVSCRLLATGTPGEIRQRTLECIEAAAPRVIVSSSNSILHGTPPENVFALHDTARQYRPA